MNTEKIIKVKDILFLFEDGYDLGYSDDIKLAERKIDAISPFKQPVIHAHWVSVPHKRARICSHCAYDEPYKFADADVYNYCPNCGADMRGETE